MNRKIKKIMVTTMASAISLSILAASAMAAEVNNPDQLEFQAETESPVGENVLYEFLDDEMEPIVSLTSSAIAARGTCGENLTWTLDYNGVLRIFGTGDMKDDNEDEYDDFESPFIGNTDIKKVIINEGVTSIGYAAFQDCSNLSEIEIPDSVTRIDDCTFSGCSSLTSIEIPASVVTIYSEEMFAGCDSLESITVDASNAVFDSRENCNAIIRTDSDTLIVGCKTTVIPDSIKRLETAAFSGCTGLTEVTIPDNVTEIRGWSFYGCSNLSEITIPDSVTTLGAWSFYNCNSLEHITLPKNLTYIDFCLFNQCSNLTSITIPASVTFIGVNAFFGCDNLTDVYYGGSKQQWDNIQIERLNENLTNATIYFNGKQKHEHPLTSVKAEAATCVSAGNSQYWECSECGKYYSDNNGTNEIDKNSWVISATGKHTWNKGKVTKEPTVFKKGVKTYTCKVCHKTKKTTLNKLTPTIKLSATKKSVKAGKSFTLTISKLAKGDSIKSVKSGNKKIVTVKKTKNNKYKITGKKKGTTKITVLLKSGKKATCKVTVKAK